MLRFILVSALVACVSAYGGGYKGSSGGGAYSVVRAAPAPAVAYPLAASAGPRVVPAAIQTRQSVEYREVPTQNNIQPTIVEVFANSIPLQILFRSSSSSLNVQQVHDGAQGSTQESSSEDEPHRLVHSVTKPIIQEVHEVITPFRKITQEIQPVQEEIVTLVAKAAQAQASAPVAPAAPAPVLQLAPRILAVAAAPKQTAAAPQFTLASLAGATKSKY